MKASATAMLSPATVNRLRAALASPRVLWGLCLLLAALCLALAVKIALLAFAGAALPEVTFPRTSAGTSQRALVLYPRQPSGESMDNLSESSVNAQLLGVISSGERAFANMLVQGKKEAVFKVGDELAPGVVIEAIEPSRVVVRERGALRRISLKSLLDGNKAAPVARAAPATTLSLPADVTPMLTASGASGLRIERISDELAALGLVNEGDVILAVNDKPLNELMADSNSLQALGAQQSLTITLERNGAETTVDVDSATARALLSQGQSGQAERQD